MLNIYFTASTRRNKDLKNNYKRIISLIKKSNIKLLSGEQIVKKNLLLKDSAITKAEIFARQKKLIDKADCIIAEVSKPSLGVGGEIVYALMHNIPVLALLYENYEDKISPMLAGNPSDKLFIEYYNGGKLIYSIKNFIKHINTLKKRKGIFIVIDGADGSGKTTQAKLLVDYLKKKKAPTKYMDFPQYYNSFHGKTVAKFLRGEFGDIDQVSPYLASLAYALDRASVKQEMEDFLKKGGIIIANRYATSNMGHQAAKFNNKEDKQIFLKWIYELEYKVHKIPKENLVIYLYVPWQMGRKLTQKKGQRNYLHGKKDIHEKDLNHIKAAEKMYLFLSKKYKWEKVKCIENKQLLTPKVIHKKIIKILKTKGFLT